MLLSSVTCFLVFVQSQPQPGTLYERINYDTKELVASRSGAQVPGRKLFVQRCNLCHIGNQTEIPFGGWINRGRIEALGEDVVREIILEGTPRMPAWKYTLTPEQVGQIIAYLKTIETDKKIEPMPPREAVIER